MIHVVTASGGHVDHAGAATFTLETDGQLCVYQNREDAEKTRFMVAAYSTGSWSHVIAEEDRPSIGPEAALHGITQLRRWAVPAGYLGLVGEDSVAVIKWEDVKAVLSEHNHPEGSAQ